LVEKMLGVDLNFTVLRGSFEINKKKIGENAK